MFFSLIFWKKILGHKPFELVNTSHVLISTNQKRRFDAMFTLDFCWKISVPTRCAQRVTILKMLSNCMNCFIFLDYNDAHCRQLIHAVTVSWRRAPRPSRMQPYTWETSREYGVLYFENNRNRILPKLLPTNPNPNPNPSQRKLSCLLLISPQLPGFLGYILLRDEKRRPAITHPTLNYVRNITRRFI